jgi:hypothetical protein
MRASWIRCGMTVRARENLACRYREQPARVAEFARIRGTGWGPNSHEFGYREFLVGPNSGEFGYVVNGYCEFRNSGEFL